MGPASWLLTSAVNKRKKKKMKHFLPEEVGVSEGER